MIALSHARCGRGQYAGAALWFLIVVLCLGRVGSLRAEAPASSWLVVESRAPASARVEPGAWQALLPGAAVLPGAEIRTGDGGMVVLRQGGDRVRLLANSTLALPSPEAGPMTRLRLWLGRAFFQVKSRPAWTFEVDTPYLVGIVKGTAFTVDVSRYGAALTVATGVVAVGKPGGPAVDVGVGKTARAFAGLDGVAVGDAAVNQAAPSAPADPRWPSPVWKPVQ